VLIDARQVKDEARLTSDVVVVGAGPAGISVVDRLRSSGLSICLITGSGLVPDRFAQQMYRGESVGAPYYSLDGCRFRQFGGGGNYWGGWCRPLDPIDFTRRDWLAWSGWPLDRAELDPYYADAAEFLRLPSTRFDRTAWPAHMPPPLDTSQTSFENAIVWYSPQFNFGASYRDRTVNAKRVTTLVHGNVTELLLDQDSRRIEAVAVRTLNGRSFQVEGRAVVLAAGGIENARLLLASRRDQPAGIGNEHDLVGRFFMEHLHTRAGYLKAKAGPIGRGFYRMTTDHGQTVRGVVTPTADAQARRRLLACSIAIDRAGFRGGSPMVSLPPAMQTPPGAAYLRLRHRRHEIAVKREAAGLRTWNAARIADAWRSVRVSRLRDATTAGVGLGQTVSLYIRAEQAPDPSSRVTLSDLKDPLGFPQARLDWRIRDADTASVRAWLSELDADMRRASLGHVVAADRWEQEIIGGAHHMGTTRMSADPATGVVDAHCRVHSVENLYVAGSSVFATSGWANPTFTLVALALRLGDELKRRLTSPDPASSRLARR